MPWELQFTDEARSWMRTLGPTERHRLAVTFRALQQRGPELGRPLADHVKRSRHHHMKELRPRRTNIRVLFAFDPNRRATILLGGDKTGNWDGWYRKHVARADRLYDQHLRNIGKGKGATWRQTRTGGRSSGR